VCCLQLLQEARKAWQDAVPVVTKDWVAACIKQKAQVPNQLQAPSPATFAEH
jgi:hypothetical protein